MNQKSKLFIVLLCCVGASLGAQRVSRIVGGSPTTISEHRYMSNMQYWLGQVVWMQFCGGSLITSRTVLSAAHCYYGDQEWMWRVLLGTSYASSGGSEHYVNKLIIHAQYNAYTTVNDVAIVVLSTPAVLTGDVRTAPIAGPNYILPDNTRVTAIGWGSLWSGGPYPEQLQHVDIFTINQEVCVERYAELKRQQEEQGFVWPYEVDNGMVCSGVLDIGGMDACQGDSGGPLAYRDVINGDIIYGITSWGAGCAHYIYPGVNARVSYYSNWIVENASV